MSFQVSPGVNISEIDLTTIVPAVSSTEGAIAGVFHWGPINKAVLIDSETTLVSRFGKPDANNAETFFTASNFLKYGNKLYVSRAGKTNDTTGVTGVLTAVANTGGYANTILIKNDDDYDVVMAGTPDTDVLYAAKYPGDLGNSLKVSVCDSVSAYSSNLDIRGLVNSSIALNNYLVNDSTKISNAGISFINGSNQATIFISNTSGSWDTGASGATAATGLNAIVANSIIVGSILKAGNTSIGIQDLRVTAIASAAHASGNATAIISLDSNYSLSTNFYGNNIVAAWEYSKATNKAPSISVYQKKFGNPVIIDEVHVVVADHDGGITGVPGTVLEVFESMSRATDAKTENGSSNYYKTVINQNSKYLWWINDRPTAVSNSALSVTNSTVFLPLSLKMVTGSDGANESTILLTDLTNAYDLFKSAEDIDISLVLQGKARGLVPYFNQLANYIIDNIVEARKDCVAYVSPDRADVVNNTAKTESTDIIAYRNALSSTSYAVLDSGYKYQYDKYNDVYRWIPLNGDIAGLTVRTDSLRDPWWSPAGFNRGQIKNIVKLAYNPAKAERDLLYKNDINPVCVFPGQGTILFGDKTLLGKPSAFDRINVRRLFIVLEKAIATAAKFTLFEFNDDFTRAQFRSLVEPFLRDIQGRRGIYDFRVICDETNNTGEVIGRGEFIGDIYIKPARSINFIQLNFVAVRSGIEFSEIVGKF